MPECGQKVEHSDTATGDRSGRKNFDDAWEAALESARRAAYRAALTWAKINVKCPKECVTRKINITLDEPPNPKCEPDKRTKGWRCVGKYTWQVTVVCRKNGYSPPEEPDKGIPHRRLKCDDEAWEDGVGQGSATDKAKGFAASTAKSRAEDNAYLEAATKAAKLRCGGTCRRQHILISVSAPEAPDCMKEDNGDWTCSTSCEYVVVADCVE